MGIDVTGFLGGGNGKVNDARNNVLGTINQEQNVAHQYDLLGNGAMSAFGRYNTGYGDALDSYARLLKADPWTDAYSTGALNNATSGVTNSFLGARASLSADLNRRGIGAPGTNSSALTGGDAAIEAARANQMSTAMNNLAMQKIQQRNSNAAALTSLYGGAADNAFGHSMGAYGAESGQLGSLYGQQNDLLQQAIAERQANANATAGLISTAASFIPGVGPALGAGMKASSGAGATRAEGNPFSVLSAENAPEGWIMPPARPLVPVGGGTLTGPMGPR